MSSIHLSRRKFIFFSLIGLTAAGVESANGNISTGRLPSDVPNPYPILPTGSPDIHSPKNELLFFSNHQFQVVAVIAALIVPTDETPGATEAGVAEYIDNLAADSPVEQTKYTKWLAWLDNTSNSQYNKSFLSLSVKEQINLLRDIEEIEEKLKYRSHGLLDRIEHKINTLWNRYFGLGDSSGFFRSIRKDVLNGYYSNPISWKGIGYFGPPQPMGYPDNAEAPSSANYSSAMRPISNSTCNTCHFDQTVKEDHSHDSDCMDCHEPHLPFNRTNNNG